jgi:hypothetical protein
LAALLYFLSTRKNRLREPRTFHVSLLVLVLLTLIKPVFVVPLAAAILIVWPCFYIKQYKQVKSMGVLALILLPLAFQVMCMKLKYGSWAISKIGGITFKDFIFSRGIMLNDTIDWEAARARAATFSKPEAAEYIMAHKSVYLQVYFTDLKENIKTGPGQLIFPKPAKAIYWMNALYYYAHLLFALPVLFAIFLACRNKQKHYFALLAVSAFFTWYILLSSGISFAQGDRLVLPAVPCFVFLYAVVFSYLNILRTKATVK